MLLSRSLMSYSHQSLQDMWAYTAVGIDHSRIFTINHKGEVRLEKLLKFKSS